VATSGRTFAPFASNIAGTNLYLHLKRDLFTVIGVVAGSPARFFLPGIPELNNAAMVADLIFRCVAYSRPHRNEWWFLWWMYRESPISNNSRGR
jgi:hypothetical protein